MTDLDDQRRFAELAELLLDGELEAGDAAELRARLAAAPAAVAELRSAVQDHMLLRAALSPGDSGQLAMRTRYLLDSWRPASRTVAAQAVLARMDRRRRWARTRFWVGVAAAAVLLVLCLPGVRQLLLAPALPADAQAPLLAEVQGEVRLASGLALRGGEHISIDATLTAGPGAAATLVWGDGTRLALTGGTTLTRLGGPGQRLKLRDGTVVVHAAHRSPAEALELVCPDATARVVGTVFSATVSAGRSRLEVSEGLVRWSRSADEAWSLVGAGQRVEAAALPLARALLLPNEQLAALHAALSAGREPWAGSWAILQAQAARWRGLAPPPPEAIDVPAYGSPGSGHNTARSRLFALTQPLLGLALAARLGGDAQLAAAAHQWLDSATRLTLSGHDGDVLCCDMLTIYGLQSADLLRAQPGWSTEDDRLIARWIELTLSPAAQRLAAQTPANARLRGLAAEMTIAAWQGGQRRLAALMEEVRATIASQLTPAGVARMRAGPEGDQQIFQCCSFALLCADLARIAVDDTTPPPPAWAGALQECNSLAASASPDSQLGFFARAFAGPGPWRLPAASGEAADADPLVLTYGWYFPTLVARDARWKALAADF